MADPKAFRVKFFDVLKRDKVLTALLSVFMTLPFFYNACGKVDRLVPLTSVSLQSVQTQSVQVNFCTPPSQPQNMYVKTLIIFDHSGSNTENYKMATDGSGLPDLSTGSIVITPTLATDPTGVTRYGTPTTPGTLLNYLSTLPANDPLNPTKFFALIDFNAGVQKTSTSFTSDITTFYNSVLLDSGQSTTPATSPSDGGATSYISALTQASNLISADIQQAQSCSAKATTTTPTASCPHPGIITPSSYVIVFMSDGSPIIQIVPVSGSGGSISSFQVQKESTTTILSDVEGLVALEQTYSKYVAAVNLFTIYYYVPGNVDSTGQTLLKQMAQDGNGISYDALSGTNINYAQFEPPTKLVQYQLTDVFVTNSSGVWWTDGLFHLDSDGDGIPDDVEIAMGSNPKSKYTFNNGLSDFVNYQLKNGAACKSMGTNGICQDAVTSYKAGLCATIAAGTGGLMYKSSDPEGLNDCEKIVLNDAAGVNSPDSNSDSIPDWLELINGVPFQANTSPAVTTPQQDGYSIYQKVKYNMPVNVPLNTAINVIPANYQVNLLSQSLTQSCYNIVVTNLPMVSSTDKIRVDVSMKNNLSTDNLLYKVGFKNFVVGSKQLVINDWTDAQEITNKTWSSWSP